MADLSERDVEDIIEGVQPVGRDDLATVVELTTWMHASRDLEPAPPMSDALFFQIGDGTAQARRSSRHVPAHLRGNAHLRARRSLAYGVRASPSWSALRPAVSLAAAAALLIGLLAAVGTDPDRAGRSASSDVAGIPGIGGGSTASSDTARTSLPPSSSAPSSTSATTGPTSTSAPSATGPRDTEPASESAPSVGTGAPPTDGSAASGAPTGPPSTAPGRPSATTPTTAAVDPKADPTGAPGEGNSTRTASDAALGVPDWWPLGDRWWPTATTEKLSNDAEGDGSDDELTDRDGGDNGDEISASSTTSTGQNHR